jgi:hypothetical protein
MNKLKLAIQDLRDYLGMDSRGKALLNKVADIANEYRKRSAACEEAAALSDSACKSLREKLVAAEATIARLKDDLSREDARRQAAEDRERSALKSLAQATESYDDEIAVKDPGVRRIAELFKNVRKRVGKKLKCDGKQVAVENYIKTFSNDEFTTLGMIVALCAFVNIPVTAVAINHIGYGRKKGGVYQEFEESERLNVASDFLRWFRDAIDWCETAHKVYSRFNNHLAPEELRRGWNG